MTRYFSRTEIVPAKPAAFDQATGALKRDDAAGSGDVIGAFGRLPQGQAQRGPAWKRRLLTLLAILGPGLIVMVGDNDAGAFGTYTQAGQNYGTSLLWTLLLLVPVLYVNQEMVLRLGAVTGTGHARLIFARFGRFWGAFSVIDLFLVNALTIVTEFIGVDLGAKYLGLSSVWSVALAGAALIGAAATGSFRRFERFMMVLVFGSLLLVPIALAVHPAAGQIAHDLMVPHLPPGSPLADVMLLIIAIVGTTVAPWQLFFQQSYVIDKRIGPELIGYERLDLWLGIAVAVVGGAAMMAFAAAAFAGTPGFGHFTDAAGVAHGLAAHAGPLIGKLFAIALIDASVIGAAAVSLSTAYAIGDVFGIEHSLHRKPREAMGFQLVYAGLIVVSALLVLVPGVPLGLLTNAVQSLAGVLLPSATVFLLLLCNDAEVLGPWRNGPWLNLFTGAVIAVLVMLSVILTAATLFPAIGTAAIFGVLGGGSCAALLGWAVLRLKAGRPAAIDRSARASWRMPALAALAPARVTARERLWLGLLRLYLLVAAGLVLARICRLAFHHG